MPKRCSALDVIEFYPEIRLVHIAAVVAIDTTLQVAAVRVEKLALLLACGWMFAIARAHDPLGPFTAWLDT